MGGFRDAVKIIDKTPEEIEQIKADVKKAGSGATNFQETKILNRCYFKQQFQITPQ